MKSALRLGTHASRVTARAAVLTPSSAPWPATTGSPDGAVVQRLPTAEAFQQQAGDPQANRSIGFWKARYTIAKDTPYKTLLERLNDYHGFNGGHVGSPGDDAVAATYNRLLQAVVEACNQYLEKPRASRRAAVEDLRKSALSEQRAVAQIKPRPASLGLHSTDPSQPNEAVTAPPAAWAGKGWKTALAETGRVHRLVEAGEFEQSLFHGTGATLLEVFEGELLSGRELAERGVRRETGEGDFFSRQRGDAEVAGEKAFVSVGQGLPGMGTALAYAVAAAEDKNYNTARYSDDLLRTELDQLRLIINNFDDNLNQVSPDDIMGARRNLGQFRHLQQRLETERAAREALPADHPRRAGRPYDESTYPLLFEFGVKDLDIKNPRENLSLRMDTDSPRPMGGERTVSGGINFRDPGRLKRVYAPLDRLDTVRHRLVAIVGHSAFDVIPLEALAGMPEAMSETQIATVETMQNLYEKMRRMVLMAYAEGMSKGEDVTGDLLKTVSHRAHLNE